MKYYILDENGNPVIADIMEWAQWFDKHKYRIYNDTVGDSEISTIFLGMYHSLGEPKLWETMVFGGKFDQMRVRCSGSLEQAEAMHTRMVEMVKRSN